MRMVMCTNRRRKMINARCPACPSQLVSGMRQLAGTERGTGGLTPLRSPISFLAARQSLLKLLLSALVGRSICVVLVVVVAGKPSDTV